MKFRPLRDRVVVRRLEAEEKSVGGIIIPDTAKENGRDEPGKFIPIDVKEGDFHDRSADRQAHPDSAGLGGV